MRYSVRGSSAVLGLVALLGVGLLAQGACTITGCSVSNGGRFAGYVRGDGNTGEGNADGDVCPEYLAFLFSEDGGAFDLRE